MDTEMAAETRKQKLSQTWCLDKEEGQESAKILLHPGSQDETAGQQTWTMQKQLPSFIQCS